GITDLTEEDMEAAKREGKRWKLIAKVKKQGGGVTASVGPEMIAMDDPLASVSGALNAITYECDLSGPVTVVGAGAGIQETGFALLIDLLNFHRKLPINNR
ncbi:MAG TPA: homoserine dehydrogenase, partial [Bacillales bacterium]|nr:homoserine dehydrogenase [Bacillales bacterium]